VQIFALICERAQILGVGGNKLGKYRWSFFVAGLLDKKPRPDRSAVGNSIYGSHETWPELADCFLAAFDWFRGGRIGKIANTRWSSSNVP